MPALEIQLENYLDRFESQDRVGLLILSEQALLGYVTEVLSDNDLYEARTWWAALTRLGSNENTFVILDTELSLEFIDIVEQYNLRSGDITIVDTRTHEIQTAQVNPQESKLLFVATVDQLEKIERAFPLTCRVGISERI